MNTQFFNDFFLRIKELLENSPAKDLDKNLRAMMTSAFAKMDLVTRNELDTQKALLARTREKLIDMEERLAKLESEPDSSAKKAT